MLNVATPAASGPLAVLALPGTEPAEADAGPAFALALDQAHGELMPEDPAAPDLLLTLVDTPAAPQVADARPSAAPRAGSSTKPDPVAPLVDALDTLLPSKAAPPDEALPTPELQRDASAADTDTDTDDAAPAAELLAWVASLPLPPPAAAAAAALPNGASPAARPEATVVDAATTVTATTPAQPTPIEAAARQDSTVLPAAAAPVAPQATSARKAETAGPRSPLPAAADSPPPRVEAAGGWLQALAAQRETGNPPGRPVTEQALPLPALPGNVAGTPPRPVEAAVPVQAEVRADIGSKEFAPALGSQLSVLVRNGIEHAQLKLNPAEMGPIEVRISIDGQQAQVDFSAAQAHTRQALQDAVPALATALRESGLTLTGGGVFEQPRESRGDAPAPPHPGGRTDAELASDEPLPPAAAPRMPRARGVLDLYA
jgi:flagellar hook-length control protein FliK